MGHSWPLIQGNTFDETDHHPSQLLGEFHTCKANEAVRIRTKRRGAKAGQIVMGPGTQVSAMMSASPVENTMPIIGSWCVSSVTRRVASR